MPDYFSLYYSHLGFPISQILIQNVEKVTQVDLGFIRPSLEASSTS